MSVAENTVTQPPATRPMQQELAVGSFVGAAGLLFSLYLIFGLVPFFWWQAWEKTFAGSQDMLENVFLADTLLLLVEAVIIGAWGYAVYQLSQKYTLSGLRAGIFFATVYLALVLVGVGALGNTLDHAGSIAGPTGWVILVVVLAAAVALAVYVNLMVPGWRSFLETVEEQGWFHATSYKGNQGVRVRRGTIVGVLAIGVTGIITMVTHRWFGFERPDMSNDFGWRIPFTERLPEEWVIFMYKIHLIMPVLLGIGLIWLAWRIVNFPAFADFLIATEAEMNKVSWTTRKRLFQDTIVVLVTVFLFTAFLFAVDLIWIQVLSAPYIKVLLIDPREQAQKQQEVAKW